MYYLKFMCRWLASQLDGLNDECSRIALILRLLDPPRTDGGGIQLAYHVQGDGRVWSRRFSRITSNVDSTFVGDLEIPDDDKFPLIDVVCPINVDAKRITETIERERIALTSYLFGEEEA
jgi:hypothetical protein